MKKLFVYGVLDLEREKELKEYDFFDGSDNIFYNIVTLTLEEVLERPCVYGISEYCKDTYSKDFDDLSTQEKSELAVEYMQGDEYYYLELCKTEEEAIQLKTELEESMIDLEEHVCEIDSACEEITERYEKEIITIDELEKLECSEFVFATESLGSSGLYEGCQWFDVKLVNGHSIDVYLEK